MLGSFVFKVCNPVYWAYFAAVLAPVKVLEFIYFLPLNMWRTIKWGWNYSNNSLIRTFMVALAIWTAIPLTWSWVFLQTAAKLGYYEEAKWVLDLVKAVGSAAFAAGKFTFSMAVA